MVVNPLINLRKIRQEKKEREAHIKAEDTEARGAVEGIEDVEGAEGMGRGGEVERYKDSVKQVVRRIGDQMGRWKIWIWKR